MKKVCYIFRKPRTTAFSIEKVFNQVVAHQAPGMHKQAFYLPHSRVTPLNILKNLWFVARLKADVYHVTGDVHYACLVLPAKKTVLTIHDCVFLETSSGLKRYLLKKLFLDWPIKKCAVVTTISHKSKAEIVQYSGCPPEKIRVVLNPVSEVVNHRPKPFNQANPVILFIGTKPNKNLEGAVAALAGIACSLVIVGKLTAEQLKLLHQHQVPYTNLVNISEQELNLAYANADVVLFPSLYEGFGLPLVEANKAGRPVVTSRLEPMISVGGNAACFVDPYKPQHIREGVLKVINNIAYREALVQAGFENVRQFEPAAVARQYYAVYPPTNNG